MPHILVLAVGRDPILLQTRAQVLEGAGYTVVSELSLKKPWTGAMKEILILFCCATPFPPETESC